jgi:hypothetical protein
MKQYYVVIQKVPGDRRTEKYFHHCADSIDDAWTWACGLYKAYGPAMRVVSVVESGEKGSCPSF